MSLIQELKRRNVFRVAIAYAIFAWLVMQIGDTMVPALHLPDWVTSLLAFFLILGFPVAMFFAWAFDLTPDGIRRDQGSDPQNTNRSQTSHKLDRVIMMVMALALGYFAVDKFLLAPADTAEAVIKTIATGETGTTPDADVSDKSIAVLPFVNMSSDPEQEYFSDGLTEELLNLLAGIDELKVAARTSSFFYKDKVNTIPLTEIARQLEVAHVLEGSVRKSGNKIRVTAQLIKASDGFHLWSETYDRDLDDIFAIQDEIAAAVTESLRITLLGEAPHARVLNTESYELTLEARFLFNRRNEGDLQLALAKFERATELDPKNAAAWLGASPLYLWMYDPPDLTAAIAAGEKAVALEPDNPEAHMRLASALMWSGQHGATADHHWNRAVELGQQNPLVLSIISGMEWSKGNIEKAMELDRRVLALDPLLITARGNFAHSLIVLGRFDEAEKHLHKIKELAPANPAFAEGMANIRLLQGKPEQALDLINQIPAGLQPSSSGDRKLQYQAMVYYSLGRLDAAETALQKSIDAFANQKSDNFDIAIIYAWRDEADKAFEWLERSLQTAPNLLVNVKLEPFLNGLHQDPRWDPLIEKWSAHENPAN